jgi:hypothetical protein
VNWMDASFARWEVEGETQQRINGALREAQQRRLARLAQGAGSKPRSAGVLSFAHAGLQRLAGRAEVKLTAVQS